jgi:hypothetical protein
MRFGASCTSLRRCRGRGVEPPPSSFLPPTSTPAIATSVASSIFSLSRPAWICSRNHAAASVRCLGATRRPGSGTPGYLVNPLPADPEDLRDGGEALAAPSLFEDELGSVILPNANRLANSAAD